MVKDMRVAGGMLGNKRRHHMDNCNPQDCDACKCPYDVLPKSCGFKAFLAAFRKKNCRLSVCEAKVQAMKMYWELPENEKEQWRKKRNCPPKCDVECFPRPRCIPPPCKVDKEKTCCKPKFNKGCCPPPKNKPCPAPCPCPPPCCDKREPQGINLFRNKPHFMTKQEEAACCVKKDEDDDDCCEPDGDSLGFKNYFKMFRCRYPYYSKCAALQKAKCKYCQLGAKAKEKYRLMGCNPKICCKPRKPCAKC